MASSAKPTLERRLGFISLTIYGLGNMLGADRGKIIKEEVDESSIYVRSNWNPDGQSSSGLVGFGIFGKRYKVNQNNEHVEEGAYNLADQAGFAQKVRGLKP